MTARLANQMENGYLFMNGRPQSPPISAQVAMATQTEFVVQEAGGHKGCFSVGCFGLRATGGLIVTFFQTLKVRMTKMNPD